MAVDEQGDRLRETVAFWEQEWEHARKMKMRAEARMVTAARHASEARKRQRETQATESHDTAEASFVEERS